ncbi:MAG TPA: arginase [Pyrinomonadaceae bacterium]|nr:arginase [Pyrinomonadaceae bacterium]
MSESVIAQTGSRVSPGRPGAGLRARIIGAPCGFGASVAGVDLGPAAMRVARLRQRVEQLGYEVRDAGDIKAECSALPPPPGEKLRFLEEIRAACVALAEQVKASLGAGEIPIVLGGDHSVAIGSVSGVSSFYRGRGEPVGLIWFDAHADMNTPETTPSGNIHGMPLAVLLGHGAPELTGIEGFSPKLDPRFCAHIGARDVDPGERELIRRMGIRFFTMREIDERGMKVCMDEAIAIAAKAPAGYHVTLDVDALDPGDAPGSGTVVRGGLTYREAHLAMEKIAEAGGALALEVVEINTALDINNRTAELGVELILSALGKTIL